MDTAAVLTEEEVRTALSVLGERLRSLLGSSLRRLVLYGSRARGDFEPDSDIDVAILVSEAGRGEKDRIQGAVAEVELQTGVPLSTLVFSQAEYDGLLSSERRLALDIDQEGIEL